MTRRAGIDPPFALASTEPFGNLLEVGGVGDLQVVHR